MDCLFCKIVSGDIPCQKVYETETVLAFKDISPQAQHHYLIIPKTHIDSLAKIEQNNLFILKDLYDVALKICDLFEIKNKGFRTVINTGKDGGQTVFHLHMHLLSGPRIRSQFGEG